MNYALTAVASLSVASLLLASGCASSQSRAHTDEPMGFDQWSDSSQCTEISAENYGHDLVIGTPFSQASVPVYNAPITQYTMSEIQAELESMHDLDRQVVGESRSSDPQQSSLASTIRAIDRAQSERLKEIVEHIGWPTRDMVGLKATQAAYMVIQHAGHDVAFQNRCLEMMVDLVAQGELPASYVALLTDRIRVFQGQPQVFGTQMEMVCNNLGIMEPTPVVPIEDPVNLDARRRLMGMPPHREFVGAINLAYQASQMEPFSAFAEVPTDD